MAISPEAIRDMGAFFVSFMESRFGMVLTYRWGDLVALDGLIRGLDREEAASLELAVPLGAYVGEVVRNRLGGEWHLGASPGGWEVRVPGHGPLRPVEVAQRAVALTQGLGEALASLGRVPLAVRVEALLQRAFPNARHSGAGWAIRAQGREVEVTMEWGDLGEALVLQALVQPPGEVTLDMLALLLLRNTMLHGQAYGLDRASRTVVLRANLDVLRLEENIHILRAAVDWLVGECHAMEEKLGALVQKISLGPGGTEGFYRPLDRED